MDSSHSTHSEIAGRIGEHVSALVRSAEGRPVGSPANHAAEEYIAEVLRQTGYEVEQQRFDCRDWRLHGAEVWLGDGPLPAVGNPYSPPCDVTAPLVAVASLGELEAASLQGRIALLHGELTATPLFPKNFPFFAVEEHQRIVALLEAGRPSAIIAVSPMSGRPAPIIEDGDFLLPSVTVPADVGAILLAAGEPVTVRVRSDSRPGHGANVIGRRPHPARDKIVVCAHFDTKPGTPGALDNAAGVASLLALAEQWSAAGPATNLEFIAFNGEDHYAAPGEVAYFARCGGDLGRIALLVNLDRLGLKDQATTVAFFACPDAWTAGVRERLAAWPTLAETAPWPQSDHFIFAMQGVPSIALTSGGVQSLIDAIIHTPSDTLDLLDHGRMATAVEFLVALLAEIGPPRERIS